MKKLSNESIKTLVLILLVISSFVQIGIHLSQQIQGFPFRFITRIFNYYKTPSPDIEYLEAGYFVPESIIVSIDREASSIWKLEKGSSYFKDIWNDVKENYLPQAIKQRPNKTGESWENVISKHCIKIDFEVKWPSDIVLWFEEVKRPTEMKGFDSIKSIAILPEENVNQTVNTVYIYDETNVYQYNVDIKGDALSKQFYLELVKGRLSNRPPVTLLQSAFNMESDDDIFVSLSNDWNSTYPTVALKIPPGIQLSEENIENEFVQDSILLDRKETLTAKYNEANGEAWFTDTENVYKLYKNGLLEYKYLQSKNKDAGNVAAALNHALSFIELRRGLLGDMEIAITDIEREANYYLMNFEYRCDGLPVYFNDNRKDGGINYPIVIKANSERVLECQWVIRSLEEVKKINGYNIYFPYMLEKQLSVLYPEAVKLSDEDKPLHFRRIDIGYVFSLEEDDIPSANPQWIISTDSGDYFIPLLKKEG